MAISIPAILLALLSALSYGLAAVLQQRGTLQTRPGEGVLRFVVDIFKQPIWLLGTLLQVAGLLFQVAALNKGSLAVVQSLIALSLVFALPFGMLLTNQRVGRRTIIGAATTVMGIVAFILIGQPQSTLEESPLLTLLSAGLVAIVLMIFLTWQGRQRQGAATAALFSTAAGLAFALGAAVLKGSTMLIGDDVQWALAIPTGAVLILAEVAGLVLAQSALKTGFLAPAMAGSNATMLIGSVLLGFIVFQESIASELHLLVMAIIGLALAAFGVVMLAHPDDLPPPPS